MPSSYRIRVNGKSQQAFKKTILGSRAKRFFLNILIPILIGIAIGTFATFILKFMGGRLGF